MILKLLEELKWPTIWRRNLKTEEGFELKFVEIFKLNEAHIFEAMNIKFVGYRSYCAYTCRVC